MKMTTDILPVGGRCGLSGCGYPPLSIVRDESGQYYEERLSDDLKTVLLRPISAEDAADHIRHDRDATA